MKYKSIAYLFAAVLSLYSCQKPFVKHWDLEVNSTAYRLGCDAGEFPLYVYCSSSWSAEFESGVEWIAFEDGTCSGSGNGVIRLSYRHNEEQERAVRLIITSGSHEKIVSISQAYDPLIFDIK